MLGVANRLPAQATQILCPTVGHKILPKAAMTLWVAPGQWVSVPVPIGQCYGEEGDWAFLELTLVSIQRKVSCSRSCLKRISF